MTTAKKLEPLQENLLHFQVQPLYDEPDVLNPLRFRRISDKLGAELFPKLSVYTQRAKYFGLLLYWAKHGWLQNGETDHRLDQLLTCAFLYASKSDPSLSSKGLVGFDTYRTRIDFDSKNDISPLNHRLAISSVDMYGPPLKAMGLLAGGRPTSRGNELLSALKLSDGTQFIEDVSGFVLKRKPLQRSSMRQLARWDLSNMTPEYKQQLRSIFGMRGTSLEPKTRALGGMLQLIDGFRQTRSKVFTGLQDGESEHLLSKSANLDRTLTKSYAWQPGRSGYLAEEKCLDSVRRYDRLLFFSQTLFELLYLRACRGKHGRLELSDFCEPLYHSKSPGNASSIDEIRSKLIATALRFAKNVGEREPLKLSSDEQSHLLKTAWAGYILCSRTYPSELQNMLVDLNADLNAAIDIKSWLSEDPLRVFNALLELHERYTSFRHVIPWMSRDKTAVVKEVADISYRPTIFSLHNSLRGFFGYRIARMAQLVGDLST